MAYTYAIIAGGGTAGHVVPGLAIAEELVERGVARDQVHYVGSSRGIEARLVPEADFPLTVLPGRGIQRRLSMANIGAVAGLIVAVVVGIKLVRRLRPAVVVVLGGYASVPCLVGAVVWRVPVVVAEQNAVPGLANRLAGRFAKASAVSYPGVDLPRSTWTGNPVSPAIRSLAAADPDRRRKARAHLGVGADEVLLVVFGGSLGARRINNAVIDVLDRWSDVEGLVVRHVTGRRDHEEMVVRSRQRDAASPRHEIVEYEDDMPGVYSAADLVICRSGASSVAELAVAGVPSILVPLPSAPGDHQTANARALVEAGAAVLVPDSELDAARLDTEVMALLEDDNRRMSMRQAASLVARPEAAAEVADLVERHARRARPGETT